MEKRQTFDESEKTNYQPKIRREEKNNNNKMKPIEYE